MLSFKHAINDNLNLPVVARIRTAAQRAAAEKTIRAIENLLPQWPDAAKQAYARGHTDGAAHERRKSWTKQPERNE